MANMFYESGKPPAGREPAEAIQIYPDPPSVLRAAKRIALWSETGVVPDGMTAEQMVMIQMVMAQQAIEKLT